MPRFTATAVSMEVPQLHAKIYYTATAVSRKYNSHMPRENCGVPVLGGISY
jgi:hypothetical protein